MKKALRETLETIHTFTAKALDKPVVVVEDDEEMFQMVKEKMQEIDASASSEIHTRLDAIIEGINQIGQALEILVHAQSEVNSILIDVQQLLKELALDPDEEDNEEE
jgi:hypothetical protein